MTLKFQMVSIVALLISFVRLGTMPIRKPFKILLFYFIMYSFFLSLSASALADFFPLGEKTEKSKFSEEHIPLKAPSDTGNRPPLIFEGGDLFLGTGNLGEGFETPWGAVWQPQLWIFGTLRTSVFFFDNGVRPRAAEWATSLDLFANLQLTHTERLIIGISPLNRNSFTRFTRVTLNDNFGDDKAEINADIRVFFFEGDLGSLFPKLDPGGTTSLDYGFAVGRQLLQFQEGILINDTVDSLGLVRNNIRIWGFSNIRSTFIWGWNELGRSNGQDSGLLDSPENNRTAHLFGWFNSFDASVSTFNLDLIHIADSADNGDGYYLGTSAIQRIGHFNTALRINSSFAEDEDNAKVGTGTLVSLEVSWTLESSDDIAYINTFVAVDNYTQAGREPIVGGPLGALGILFASPSLGNFLSELSSFSDDVVGATMGYQAFWNNHRRSLTLEMAGRIDTGGSGFNDVAVGFEYRHRLAHRVQLQLEASYSVLEKRDDGSTLRAEILVQF